MIKLAEHPRGSLRTINDIDPELYYVQSWLTLTGLSQRLAELRNQGRIEFRTDLQVPNFRGTCYSYLGADIIAAYHGRDEELRQVRTDIERLMDADPGQVMSKLRHYDLMRRNLRKLQRQTVRMGRLEAENAQLRQRLQQRSDYVEHIGQLFIDRFLADAQLFELSTVQLEDFCGIYLLYQGHTLMYIGQSVNILSRLQAHLKEKAGKFDSVRYFQCRREELDEKELFLIQLLKPPLNGAYKNGDHRGHIRELILNTVEVRQ